jgi:hypothetical protein
MSLKDPQEILVQCKGCKIENLLDGYVVGSVQVCNQCREILIDPGVGETHCEFACEDCGFHMMLLKETAVEEGQASCRCGSARIARLEPSPIAVKLKEIGLVETDEDALEAEDGFDWCRSEPQAETIEDFNDLFDNDPGMK